MRTLITLPLPHSQYTKERLMYYVETRVVLRVGNEIDAKNLWWLEEAIEKYLRENEEIVCIDAPKVTNEE